VRRLPKTAKPASEVSKKREADRLHNLALSAQARLDDAVSKKQSLEKEIADLVSQREIEIDATAQTLAYLKEVLGKKNLLDSEIGFKQTQSSDLDDLITSKEEELKTADERLAGLVKEAAKEVVLEVARLEKEQKTLLKEIHIFEKKKMDIQGKVETVQNELTARKREVILVKKERDSLESQKNDLTKTLLVTQQQLQEAEEKLKKMLASIEQSQDLSNEVERVRGELEYLKQKVNIEQAKFNSFSEEMDKKVEAFRKLERGVEQKTLRLTAIMDEKGIEKYLKENNVI